MTEKIKEIHRILHRSETFKGLHDAEDFRKVDRLLDEMM